MTGRAWRTKEGFFLKGWSGLAQGGVPILEVSQKGLEVALSALGWDKVGTGHSLGLLVFSKPRDSALRLKHLSGDSGDLRMKLLCLGRPDKAFHPRVNLVILKAPRFNYCCIFLLLSVLFYCVFLI